MSLVESSALFRLLSECCGTNPTNSPPMSFVQQAVCQGEEQGGRTALCSQVLLPLQHLLKPHNHLKALSCSTSEPSFPSAAQSSSSCPKTRMVVPVSSTQILQATGLQGDTSLFPNPPVTEKSTKLLWKVIVKVGSLGKAPSPRNKAKSSGHRLLPA